MTGGACVPTTDFMECINGGVRPAKGPLVAVSERGRRAGALDGEGKCVDDVICSLAGGRSTLPSASRLFAETSSLLTVGTLAP